MVEIETIRKRIEEFTKKPSTADYTQRLAESARLLELDMQLNELQNMDEPKSTYEARKRRETIAKIEKEVDAIVQI